jgi:hypothetical protein
MISRYGSQALAAGARLGGGHEAATEALESADTPSVLAEYEVAQLSSADRSVDGTGAPPPFDVERRRVSTVSAL